MNKVAALNLGLKKMTKAHSVQVCLAKGGKKFIKDGNKPNRKYKVKGEQ